MEIALGLALASAPKTERFYNKQPSLYESENEQA
jgi:hypothetical protein